MSEKDVAQKFNCSRTPITALLREKGAEIRSAGRQQLPLDELSESSHRKRFHDERERFPMEKRGNQGALFLEIALKNWGYRQSDINRVFSWYIGKSRRYNLNPQLTARMFLACEIKPEQTNFLAEELNEYVNPKPDEPLSEPIDRPVEKNQPQPTAPSSNSPVKERALYRVLKKYLINDAFAIDAIIETYRQNPNYYHTHPQLLVSLINDLTRTNRGLGISQTFFMVISPDEGAT